MILPEAEQIVAEMVQFAIACQSGEKPQPFSRDYSLAEMVEANAILSAITLQSLKNMEKGRVYMTCDDRLTAAIYTLLHYEALPVAIAEPIIFDGERGVCCVQWS